jgi:hypothetical protein
VPPQPLPCASAGGRRWPPCGLAGLTKPYAHMAWAVRKDGVAIAAGRTLVERGASRL